MLECVLRCATFCKKLNTKQLFQKSLILCISKNSFRNHKFAKKKLKSLSAKLTIKSKTQIVCFFWSLFDHFVGLELQGLNVTTSSAKYFFTTFSNSDSETKIEKLRTLLLFFYGLIAINNSIVSTYIQR